MPLNSFFKASIVKRCGYRGGDKPRAKYRPGNIVVSDLAPRFTA